MIGLAWFIVFGKNSLTLDGEGFIGRTTRIRWRDVRDFQCLAVGTTTIISYDHTGVKESAFARWINRATNRGNSSMAWTFGLSGPEAAALLNAWRERALQGEQSDQSAR